MLYLSQFKIIIQHAFIFIATLLIGYLTFTHQKLDLYLKTKSALLTFHQNQTTYIQETKQLAHLKKALLNYQQKASKRYKQPFTTNDCIKSITGLMKTAQLKLTEITPTYHKGKVTIAIITKGQFADFIHFLKQLQTSVIPIIISNISLQKNQFKLTAQILDHISNTLIKNKIIKNSDT